MIEMIERMARAIAQNVKYDNEQYRGSVDWRDYIDAAFAAIKAMREPTQAMLDEVKSKEAGTRCVEPHDSAWRIMIDTALGVENASLAD